jgi:putative hydrolase of the HAD superfamily
LIHKKKVKLVVFDIDDTLYPERLYCQSGFRAVSKYLAESKGVCAESFYESLCQAFDRAGGKLFNLVLDKFNISYDEEFIEKIVAVYREHKPHIQLWPDAEEVLNYLKERYNLAIISDGFMPAQKLKAEALELDKWFEAAIFTEELGREYWKPSCRAFEIVSNKFAVAPEKCVYIADNPAKDFYAPNKLGWQSIMLEQNDAIHSPVALSEEYEPGIKINSLCLLERIL